MYARPQPRQTPRSSELASYPAPKAGWIANRNLAQPNEGQQGQGAMVLENFFPTARGAVMRRGSELYATLGLGTLPVTALFSYRNGNQEEFFGATENAIYNITTILSAENYSLETDEEDIIETDTGDTFGEDSTLGLEVVEGLTGGDWVVVQFTTSGGTFLVCVNGVDEMLIYDGTFWYPVGSTSLHTLAYDGGTVAFTVGQVVTGGTSATTGVIKNISGDAASGTLIIDTLTGGPFVDNEALTDPLGGAAVANGANVEVLAGITGVATSVFDYVWVYQNRLFFVELDSMKAWYLPVDAIGGAAADFPLGGLFDLGGSLLFGQSWSLESGDGLNARCIFVTTEGEVAVYSGLNPADANDWRLIGVYRMGKPLGKQAHMRAGGDIITATDVGFVPLSSAVKRDLAALGQVSISYPIEDEWNKAVERRSAIQWRVELWPAKKMVAIALPTVTDELPTWFVANSQTGAWAPFTGWDATCMEVFQDQLYFGSTDGRVVKANVTGADEGNAYTAIYVPLFDHLKSPASLKVAKMARAVTRSQVPAAARMSMQTDYNINLPTAPSATPVLTSSEWGTAIWGTSTWGEAAQPTTTQQWQSVGGAGYALAPGMQVTSGSIVPLDVEIVRLDSTFTIADIVS